MTGQGNWQPQTSQDQTPVDANYNTLRNGVGNKLLQAQKVKGTAGSGASSDLPRNPMYSTAKPDAALK